MLRSIVAIAVLVLLTCCKRDPLANMPDFDILLSDSATVFNTAKIPTGKTVVMIHFDSQCGDCQRETQKILQNMDQLRNVQFYFLTVEKMDDLRLWEDYFNLKKYPNIVAGKDTKQAFPRHFQSRSTPLLAIYDKQKKLKGVFEGEADIKELITKINEAK